jgi:hypothetical protein
VAPPSPPDAGKIPIVDGMADGVKVPVFEVLLYLIVGGGGVDCSQSGGLGYIL